jgi:UBA/TS-N domain
MTQIRGDYGATFRTGSTIIVTLDTDAGTLSFSSWKDNNSSGSFSLDPLLQNQSATRRHGNIGGTVEDWGVAFEGLPLDSRLYPAVGLYQRDDRVTLLTVENNSRNTGRDGSLEISGGLCYYPLSDAGFGPRREAAISQVRRFNDVLSWEGVQYVLEMLHYTLKCLENGKDAVILAAVLPSFTAALCLVPNSIPILSERFALTLLPHLGNFLLMLDAYRSERQMVQRLFRTGLMPGKWTIRATGSSGENSDFEEYVVDFTSTVNEQGIAVGFEGTGVGTTGKSKNGLVAIFGTTQGSAVHFVEEWSDGSDEGFGSSTPDDTSSCVVAARISLNGTKFEGSYRNVQFGTSGKIAGVLQTDHTAFSKIRMKEAPSSSKQSAELADGVVMGEAILCLAYNHMATIIGEDAAGDQLCDVDVGIPNLSKMRRLLAGQLLCGSSQPDKATLAQIAALREQYSWKNDFDDLHGCRQLRLLETPALQESLNKVSGDLGSLTSSEEVLKKAAALDIKFAPMFGAMGSLRGLCQNEYDDSRRRIISTFVKPCGLENLIDIATAPSQVDLVWKTSRKIMEDGLRDAMSNLTGSATKKESCAARCRLYNQVSAFLSSLEYLERISVSDAAREIASVYRSVTSESDLQLLQTEMEACSRRSLLRLISVQDVVGLFSRVQSAGHNVDSFIALESLIIGLPRMLGRSPADSLSRIRKQGLARPESPRGTSPVHSISGGAGRLTRVAFRNYVHQLFALLGQIASSALKQRVQAISSETVISVDSLLLSLVTVFTITMQDENIDEIVRSSGVIGIMTELLAVHRTSMTSDSLLRDNEQESMVMKLQGICEREVSRSVLRACVAATHTLVFQTSSRGLVKVADEATSETAAACFDIVFREIKSTVELAEKAVVEAEGIAIRKRADGDCEKFCESVCPALAVTSGEKKKNADQVGSAGLMYLQKRGTAHTYGLVGNSQKSSSRQKNNSGASVRVSADNPINFQSGFLFQLLSQWLHILCGVLFSPIARSLLGHDLKWTSLLLRASGISVCENEHEAIDKVSIRMHSEGLLPARFRSRILRFLFYLLESAVPSDSIVEGLLCLAGMGSPTMPRSLDEDEKFVAREAITLLRQLHNPARTLWRDSVNRVIAEAAVSSPDDKKVMLRLGVLSFLAGNMEVIGRGSYVLLKPAAAVPLSIDQQSLPSGKGHASGVGGSGSGVGVTPHHTVGNGTEGVVAGLCRHEASAGLVSNIDMKNGICEVVLITRDPSSSDENGESLLLSKPSGSSGSRHTLTVRALRTALSDVVHAQEAPLHLDETMTLETLFGSLMEPALASLLAVMKPASTLIELGKIGEDAGGIESVAGLKSGSMSISASIMLLRSAIVVLSDQRIASTFLQSKESKEILARILRLAWPADSEKQDISDFVSKAQRSFLSSLPFHEARYGHLVSILHDLSLRADAVSGLSSEEWIERVQGLQARQTSLRQAENKDISAASSSAESQGSAAPSDAADSVTVSGQTQAAGATTSAAATGNDAEAGSRTAEASNRAVSQSTMSSQSEDEEESEAAATAAAHLREAAIAQMAELGLPRSWSELALRRTGGNDIEAAVHFCLERGGEMERLLAEERERERLMQRQAGGGQPSRRRGYRGESGSSNHLLRQLLEMGFPSRWCAEALAATGNNVDEALTWILTHGERLSEEDEAMEDEDNGEDIEDEDESVEDDEDDEEDGGGSISGADAVIETAPTRSTEEIAVESAAEGALEPVWSGSVVPLRFISGRSIIDSKTLAISGLPTGGFSSVGTKGILLCSGKWYYEAILETAGCLQIGWADGSFAGHCHADRGDGTGDGPR